jgi:hypothetical protein
MQKQWCNVDYDSHPNNGELVMILAIRQPLLCYGHFAKEAYTLRNTLY